MRKTQKEKILEYLKKFGSITWLEAYRDLGIARLGARIFELKEDGYLIESKTEHGKNRFKEKIHYSRYVLKKKRRIKNEN